MCLQFTVYLVHWPVHLNPNGNHPLFPTLPNGHRDVVHDWPLRETWKQMEAMVKKGKVRSIGVSNTSQRKLEEEILPYAEIPPAVDQVHFLRSPSPSMLAHIDRSCILYPVRDPRLQPAARVAVLPPQGGYRPAGVLPTRLDWQPARVR